MVIFHAVRSSSFMQSDHDQLSSPFVLHVQVRLPFFMSSVPLLSNITSIIFRQVESCSFMSSVRPLSWT